MTTKDKLNEILLKWGVRSSYPERLKEELLTLIVSEAKEIINSAPVRTKKDNRLLPGDRVD